MIASLPEKTGKSLDEWRQVVVQQGLAKHTEIVNFLKTEHALTHGYAHQIALRSKPNSEEAVDPIEALFTKKEQVRPIYEAIVQQIKSLGTDIEFAPKKAYLSVRRNKQFAILQPAAGRLDVGINLKGVEPSGRLEASGSFNAMLTHRVRVTSRVEIDDELIAWLRAAYHAA